ncbi:GTP-binding protein Era [Lachnospiraceae bacterium NE2001]|nr:GTP-binding protein Era [Lachnospiraceae bacterium NE2001]
MENNTFKSGFIAILGRPNVGKSTLMNHLIGMKIAAVSKRAQTTRKRIQTVYTDDRGQIIFLDTPGVNKAETKLGEFMLDSATETLKTADMVMWIIEPSSFIGMGEKSIVEMISKAGKLPLVLLINKCDTATEEQLSKTEALYTDYLAESGVEVTKVFAVSATEGTRLDDLMQGLYDILPEGPMYFDEDTVTDETERDIAAEFIREKCLRNLDKEIPHGIAVIIDKMRERPDGSLVDIEATIICERESHKGIIIGKKGAMLKKIGIESRKSIEEMLDMKVNLKLWVKVRPDWRNKTSYMSEYGYHK